MIYIGTVELRRSMSFVLGSGFIIDLDKGAPCKVHQVDTGHRRYRLELVPGTFAPYHVNPLEVPSHFKVTDKI